MSDSDVQALQSENEKLRQELESSEKSFAEHKEKAKKIVKTQKVKMASLLKEIEELKGKRSRSPVAEERQENEALRNLLDQKSEQILELQAALDKDSNTEMNEKLRAAEEKIQGNRVEKVSNFILNFPNFYFIFRLNHLKLFELLTEI